MSMNSAYTPKRLDANVVRLQNLIATRKVQIPIVLAGQKGKLSLTHGLVERQYNLAVQILVNQVSLGVLLDTNLVDWYLMKLDAGVGFADLSAAIRETVLKKAVFELVSGISKSLKLPIGVQQVRLLEHIPPSPCACHGTLTLADQSCALEFIFGQDAAFNLEKFFGLFPMQPQSLPERMPVTFSFEKGRTTLSLEALHQLELFDVILFDQTWDGVLVRSSLGKSYASDLAFIQANSASVSDESGALHDEQPLEAETGPARYKIVLEALVEESENVASIENIGALPVNVTFEIGRTELPLEDLNQLSEGYTFSLPANVQAPIEVRVNGKIIGLAELVQIGDTKLGARILTLQKDQ